MFPSAIDSCRTFTALCFLALAQTFVGMSGDKPLAAQDAPPGAGGGQSPAVQAASADRAAPAAKSAERLREGTRLVEVPGTFASLGADRVSFSPDGGKESYRLLQNLAMERISRMLEEQRGLQKWTVSGVLTEYKGSNFLLVTKWQSLDDAAAAGR